MTSISLSGVVLFPPDKDIEVAGVTRATVKGQRLGADDHILNTLSCSH